MKTLPSSASNRFRAERDHPSFHLPANNRKTQRIGRRLPWEINWALSFLLLLVSWCPARAACADCGTTISGYLIDTSLTAVNSPYCVTGDIYVLGGVTVEPGVTLQFCGNYEFEVGGILQVKGTAEAPVVFTSGTTNGWKGILFRDAVPGSFFTQAIIEGAKQSGVRITNTPPRFTNCIIRGNSSPDYGGGLLAGLPPNQKLVMEGCTLSNNLANLVIGSGYGYGGGMYVNGSMLLQHCTIVSNWTHGYYGYGGGIFSVYGDCTLRNCTISGNMVNASASDDAAGVYFDSPDYTATLDMKNCIVAANGLAGAGAQYSGGGVMVWRGNTKLANSLVVSNQHEGIYVRAGTGSIVNCTVVYNDASHYGIYSYSANVYITNCIVYYQYGPNVAGNVCVAWSDVQGGVQPCGPGNISYAPGLRPGTFELLTGSPCIDAGCPEPEFYDRCFPPSRGVIRNDMGAYGGPGACGWGTDPNAPVIMAALTPQWGCPGSGATFSTAAATAAGPLRYQWFRKTNSLPGQTGAALRLTNLRTNDVGYYSVMISNGVAGVSATALLSMYDSCVDLRVSGTERTLNISPAGAYDLRYTTNAANTNFATWTRLATNPSPGSVWSYRDTNSPLKGPVFYGVKRLP